MLKTIYIALFAPFSGIKMIFRDRVLLLSSIIPILVNTLLYLALAFLVYNYYGEILSMMVSQPDTFIKKVLYWSLFVFLLLFVLMIFVFSFNIIGSMLLTPFNNTLAKTTYRILTGQNLASKAKGSGMMWKDMYKSFMMDLRKLLFVFLPIGLLFVLSFFFPFLSIFALILSFLAISYQYMDYVMEERGLNTRDKLKLMLKNPLETIGFGFVVSIIVSIPVLGLIIIPSSVVGATMLYHRIEFKA